MKLNKLVLFCFIIFICFHSLYFTISYSLSKTIAFSEMDLLFGIDVTRVIGDNADFDAWLSRTIVHPLYVILMNPIGILLGLLLKNAVILSVVINSFFGAIGIVLAFIFFWLFNKDYKSALLLSILFGLTNSQLIFSIIPDVSTLAVCSLLITYILFLLDLNGGNVDFIFWVFAGVFSLGVTATNFVQTFICYCVIRYVSNKEKIKKASLVYELLLFVIVVFAITVFISILQKLIYPSAGLFFMPKNIFIECIWISDIILKRPLEGIIQLIEHFFVVNIITPFFTSINNPKRIHAAITFSKTMKFSIVGLGSLVVWTSMFIFGFYKSIFDKKKYIFLGIYLCVLFNMIFHSFYGMGNGVHWNDLFLYTGNYTFLILIFISYIAFSKNKYARYLLISLIMLVGLNNFMIIKNIINYFNKI